MRVSPLVAVVVSLLLSACATIRPTPAPPEVAAGPIVHPPAVEEDDAGPSAPELEIACVQEASVESWERRFRSNRGHWEGHLDHPWRGGRYFDDVQRMVCDAGLPPEVAFLPTIESGYRSDVRGLGGSGLWQLGAATARRYGLVVTRARDDRLNPTLATRAAIRHLQYLYDRYGDWPLALAAYNAGEGTIDRALRSNPGASFWDLAEQGRLPPVTRAYVPKLLGLVRAARPSDCVVEDASGGF